MLKELSLDKKQLLQSQVYEVYNERRVRRWVEEGLIERVSQQGKYYYDKCRLEELSEISKISQL